MMDFLTIAQAAALIAKRALSPVELAQQCLGRIATVGAHIHSFINVTPERALDDARAAEHRMMTNSLKGRLDGIPIAHKDIFSTRAIATTAHSRLLAHRVPDEDAHAVSKLAEAGTSMLGKLATHEFALGGPSFDLPWPRAQSLEHRALHFRLFQRAGSRSRSRPLFGSDGFRHRWIHS